MELNEREKNIVNLIDQLSEMASDEKSTQEAIEGILAKIKNTTKDNIRAEMDAAKKEADKHRQEAARQGLPEGMKSIVSDKTYGTPPNFRNTFPSEGLRRLLFTRIREVKVPCKAHPTDAGIDFFVPDAKAWDVDFRNKVIEYSRNSVPSGPNEGVEFVDSSLVVHPRAHVAIPSGIKTIIPVGLAMMMVNKSGVATKLKLDHSACLIDSEYRDELIFCFFNHNTEVVEIKPGMKLTQGLLVPVINLELNEVLNCVYEDMGKSTDRGGGFGSTDQK